MNLELTGQLPPQWLAFIVLEGAMQATGGEKTSEVLPRVETSMLQCYSARQDMPTKPLALIIMEATNPFLTRFEAVSTGENL